MKGVSKFKRWLLRLFGGVPKIDYDIVVKQRENFIGDLRINESRIKELERENKELKSQLAKDPTTPVYVKAINMQPKVLEQKFSYANIPFQLNHPVGEMYIKNELFRFLAEDAQKYMIFNRDDRNQQYIARIVIGEETDVL